MLSRVSPGVLGLALACDASPASVAPQPRAAADPAVVHHPAGPPIGWTARAGVLFATPRDASPAAVLAGLRAWLGQDARGLTPAGEPRRFGGLQVHRFVQRYRGVPAVGGGAAVVVSVGPRGAVRVQGAVADEREDYAGWRARLDAAAAGRAAAARFAAEPSGPARLVAVVELRTLAWEVELARGTALLAADDGRPLGFSAAEAGAPGDVEPVTVRVRGFASDPFLLFDPAAPQVVDAAEDPVRGGPLLGSRYTPIACDEAPGCGELRLGNPEVVVVDAQRQPFVGLPTAAPRILTSASGEFLADPPATADDPAPGRVDAALADSFYRVQAAYAVIDGYQAGRWDSLRLSGSTYTPTSFRPRVVVAERSVDCGANAACVKIYYPRLQGDQNYAEPPLADLPPQVADPDVEDPAAVAEPLAYIGMSGADSFSNSLVLLHEFGHVVDLFSGPGLLGNGVVGSGCALHDECQPACNYGTVDESDPLGETVADMFAAVLVDQLYRDIPYTRCSAVQNLSNTAWAPVHHPDCMVAPEAQVRSFGQERPDEPGYADDAETQPTGKCARTDGYRQAAIMQGWWEWLHGQRCFATEQPCVEFAAPDEAGEIGAEALLFALAQGNASFYLQWFRDMRLYIGCAHGPALADAFQQIFCHHKVLPCETPPPLECAALCGDGLASADESCDGADLRGQSCEGLGLSAGELRCADDCSLDLSGCAGAGETSSGEASDGASSGTSSGAPVPTTGVSSDGASGSSGAGTDGPASAGELPADGCGCAAGPPGWPALALLLARRRRRA